MNQSQPPEKQTILTFPDEADEGFDFRRWLWLPWQYKWLIAGVFIIAFGAAWLWLKQAEPRYTSTALLLIEPQEKNVVDLDAVVKGLGTDPETIHAEIVVLQSRELAAKTAEELGLFKGVTTPPSQAVSETSSDGPAFDWRKQFSLKNLLPATWYEFVFPEERKRPTTPEERQEHRRLAITNGFLGGLSISSVRESRVVRVAFTSTDPEFAAKAANAHADQYVLNTLEVKFAGTEQANRWIRDRLDELRQNVERAESEVERLRRAANVVQGRSVDLVAQEMSQVNAQLIAARAELAQKLARLRQLESLRAAGGDALDGMVTSSFITALREKELQLRQEMAELSVEYGDEHPRMINIRAEIGDVQERIQSEVESVLESLRNDVSLVRVRERELQRSLDKLTAEANEINEADVELRVLEREANANRVLYDTFLTRFKETSLQQDFQQPDARIVSRAQVPTSPSYPHEQETYQMAALLAAAAAAGLIFLLEMMQRGFRTVFQLERATGYPNLAVIPMLDKKRRGRIPANIVIEKPNTRYAESVRILRSVLAGKGEPTSLKVLITSALPKEGKSSLAVSMMRSVAMSGGRALLIDGDIRHPQCARALGLKSTPGLAEYLNGEAALSEVIQFDEASGGAFIAAGHWRNENLGLLEPERIERLLSSLQSSYSLIVFDSSPILAVAETRTFAQVVDKVALVVRWWDTPRATVNAAIDELRHTEAPIAGTVLSIVDMRKQSQYGYGEYGYYSYKMKDYYSG